MGTSLTPSHASGRRPLDASLNLVPFIDLLSCCIAFLLLTAVWSQVAGIDVQSGGAATEPRDQPEPLTLFIGARDYELRLPGGASIPVEKSALASALRSHRAGRDDLVVQSDDGVKYDRLIVGLDAARDAGFAHLQIP